MAKLLSIPTLVIFDADTDKDNITDKNMKIKKQQSMEMQKHLIKILWLSPKHLNMPMQIKSSHNP
jgi:hypothetical protein